MVAGRLMAYDAASCSRVKPGLVIQHHVRLGVGVRHGVSQCARFGPGTVHHSTVYVSRCTHFRKVILGCYHAMLAELRPSRHVSPGRVRTRHSMA